MDKAEHLIGLSFRGGRAVAGEEPVAVAIAQHKVRLLLVAEDAAPATKRRAESFAQEGDCLLAEIPYGKDQLGSVTGRSACAIVGITDLGLAGSIATELSQNDLRFLPLQEKIKLKQQRAQERKDHPRPREKKEDVPPQGRPVREKKNLRSDRSAKKSGPKGPRENQTRSRYEGSLPVHKGKGSPKKTTK